MNALFPFLWVAFWAVLSQVFLFRFGVFLGGYGLLIVHVYGIMKMPIGWSPSAYLLIASLAGGMMDLMCFTGGMHLAASATLGMAYPSLTASLAPREGLRQGHVIDPFQDGWLRYALFIFMGLFLYWLIIFGLQNGWPRFGRTLLQSLTSTALNVMVFLLIQGLLNRPNRGAKTAVRPTPWS